MNIYIVEGFKKEIEKLSENICKTPGEKIRSKGKGRGLARGEGRGPIGVPIGRKKDGKRPRERLLEED